MNDLWYHTVNKHWYCSWRGWPSLIIYYHHCGDLQYMDPHLGLHQNYSRDNFFFLSYIIFLQNGKWTHSLWWPSSQEPNATTGDWHKLDWHHRSVKWKLKSADLGGTYLENVVVERLRALTHLEMATGFTIPWPSDSEHLIPSLQASIDSTLTLGSPSRSWVMINMEMSVGKLAPGMMSQVYSWQGPSSCSSSGCHCWFTPVFPFLSLSSTPVYIN